MKHDKYLNFTLVTLTLNSGLLLFVKKIEELRHVIIEYMKITKIHK